MVSISVCMINTTFTSVASLIVVGSLTFMLSNPSEKLIPVDHLLPGEGPIPYIAGNISIYFLIVSPL